MFCIQNDQICFHFRAVINKNDLIQLKLTKLVFINKWKFNYQLSHFNTVVCHQVAWVLPDVLDRWGPSRGGWGTCWPHQPQRWRRRPDHFHPSPGHLCLDQTTAGRTASLECGTFRSAVQSSWAAYFCKLLHVIVCLKNWHFTCWLVKLLWRLVSEWHLGVLNPNLSPCTDTVETCQSQVRLTLNRT